METQNNVTNERLDAIQKKLRKLQKLYEGAKAINSEGEAQAAAAAIQRILLEYNLTMEEVGVEKDENAIGSEDWSGYTYKSIGGWWEQKLVNVLCRYNFCRCFVYGKSYKKLNIVGNAANMQQVRWFREFLSDVFVKLSKEAWKKYQGTQEYAFRHISKDKYQRSFLSGCVVGLSAKLAEEWKRDKEDQEIGARVTALILRRDAEIDEWVKNKYGKLGSIKTSDRYDAAYFEGIEAGRNVQLNRPISGHKSSLNIQLIG